MPHLTCPPPGHSRFKFSWYSPAHGGQDWRFIIARDRKSAERLFAHRFGKPDARVKIANVGSECW